MEFDISTLAITDSTVLHLLHPVAETAIYVDKDGKMTLDAKGSDGKSNKPVTVTVASTASKAYRKAVSSMQNRALKRGNKKLTAEQQKEENTELLVSCCTTSENLVYLGSPVKTDSDFRALLSDDKLSWIKHQIDECIGNVELFIA